MKMYSADTLRKKLEGHPDASEIVALFEGLQDHIDGVTADRDRWRGNAELHRTKHIECQKKLEDAERTLRLIQTPYQE